MVKTCDKPVKANPFTTYRDPQTGKWLVLQQAERELKEKTEQEK